MLKITYFEEVTLEHSDYDSMLCMSNDTPFLILKKHGVNLNTSNVYLNGDFIAGPKLQRPFRELIGSQERAFLTVRRK